MPQGRTSDGWRIEPVIDWLLREGRLDADPRRLIDALAERLVAAGAPLCRLRLAFFTLHPQLAAWAYVWMRGRKTSEERIPYDVRETGAYIGSPAQAMIEAGAPVRYRLDRLAPGDHRVLHELAAAGGTDYALLPLRFSDGSLNVLAVTTDHVQGFGSEDLKKFDALCHALAPVLEVAATRRLAETLYGNVGAPDRLDFTVLGPAVNRAARLETLTKQLEVPLLMSLRVAAKLERPVRSLGLHRLRDLIEPMEVFALAPAPAAKDSCNRNLEELTS